MKFALAITHFENSLPTVYERFTAENKEEAIKYAKDVFEAFQPKPGASFEDYDFEVFNLDFDLENPFASNVVYASYEE